MKLGQEVACEMIPMNMSHFVVRHCTSIQQEFLMENLGTTMHTASPKLDGIVFQGE